MEEAGEAHQRAVHLHASSRQVVASERIMNGLIPTRDLLQFLDKMEDELKDKQSADLARDVYMTLSKRLTLSDNEERALNRLVASVQRNDWDAATQRNNIFKAADLLRIHLPSYIFASDQSLSGTQLLERAKDNLTQATFDLRRAAELVGSSDLANDYRVLAQLGDMASRVEDVQLEVAPLLRAFRNRKLAFKGSVVTYQTFEDMARAATRKAEDSAMDASGAFDGMADKGEGKNSAELRQAASAMRAFAGSIHSFFRLLH